MRHQASMSLHERIVVSSYASAFQVILGVNALTTKPWIAPFSGWGILWIKLNSSFFTKSKKNILHIVNPQNGNGRIAQLKWHRSRFSCPLMIPQTFCAISWRNKNGQRYIAAAFHFYLAFMGSHRYAVYLFAYEYLEACLLKTCL